MVEFQDLNHTKTENLPGSYDLADFPIQTWATGNWSLDPGGSVTNAAIPTSSISSIDFIVPSPLANINVVKALIEFPVTVFIDAPCTSAVSNFDYVFSSALPAWLTHVSPSSNELSISLTLANFPT